MQAKTLSKLILDILQVNQELEIDQIVACLEQYIDPRRAILRYRSSKSRTRRQEFQDGYLTKCLLRGRRKIITDTLYKLKKRGKLKLLTNGKYVTIDYNNKNHLAKT